MAWKQCGDLFLALLDTAHSFLTWVPEALIQHNQTLKCYRSVQKQSTKFIQSKKHSEVWQSVKRKKTF